MRHFAAASGRALHINGTTRQWTGANCYYLPSCSRTEVDALFDAAALTGVEVLRTLGFLDEAKNGVRFQSWDPARQTCCIHPGPDGLERLDHVIATAARRNIRLLLPLVNNWDDFGGMNCYCGWLGLPDHDDFYESPAARTAYRNWCSQLLNRVNTVTGVAYRDEPAILGWELANEARCGRGVAPLERWIGEMSEHVKRLAPNQLVGLGDEGMLNRAAAKNWLYNGSCGYDFDAFLRLPAVDFASFHLYPETWGQAKDFDAALNFGRRWILDHAESGDRAGKPVLLEEYGIKNKDWRDPIYAAWLAAARGSGIAADLHWMLAAQMDSGEVYPDYDGFTLYAHSMPPSIVEHVRSARDV